MPKKILIVVCEKFRDETLALQSAEGSPEFEVICFPARCGCPEVNWDELGELITPVSASSEIHIMGSCCIVQLPQTPAPFTNCTLHHRKQCFYLFSSSSHIDSLIENGSYLTTPGWLNQWRLHLEELGFNHADEARDFFRQSSKNITLLDTLISPDSIFQSKEFSDFVDLPVERVPVGLDFYQLFVHRILAEKEIQTIASESNAHKDNAANCMMSMDVLAGLSTLHEEDRIIKAVIELFTILFSPQKITFFPPKDKVDKASCINESNGDYPIPWEKIYKEKFALIESDKVGFWILLQSENLNIGVIKIHGIAFPEYIRDYLNLALPISRICGIMIRNARTRKELNSAQKMVAISTMAGGIAHNFNNILATVLGYMELALEEIPESNQGHDYINKALKSANKVKDLVSQIMLFSKQKTSEPDSCSPAVLLPKFIDELRNKVPANILLKQDILTDLGDVVIDEINFKIIFYQLCSNSIDALQESGGVLTVALGKIELREEDLLGKGCISPGHFLHMTITDTGQGIHSENIARIFDPFFTTKDVGKGDGIGLSVVKGLLEKNCGMIQVESEIDKGSTFTVYLPSNEADKS